MNSIKFPLQPHMQGDLVADLQEGLQLLLAKQILQVSGTGPAALQDRLRIEQSQHTYGETTGLLVSLFQQSRAMPASGAVDEATARALNVVLAGLGAFAALPPPADTVRVVAGQLRHDTGRPVAGAIVRAVHLADRAVVRLGDDVTDQDGRYAVRYQMLPGVTAISLRVTAVDPKGAVLAEAKPAEPAPPLAMLDLVVPAGADAAVWSVAGRVTSSASAATGGLRVRIVDKMAGAADVPLVDALSGDDGRYAATFPATAFAKRDKTAPDLQARVFAGDTLVGASSVRYNAKPRETLNVDLSDGSVPALRSEHDTVTAAIARQFSGRLADLQENDERSDITYLANKTGWDARAVALASLAAQFSARSAGAGGAAGLDAPLFYALFRGGLPANESALYRADASTVQALWTKAGAQGIITPLPAADLKAAVSRFQQLAATHALDAPALRGVSTLKELVSLALPAASQQKFAELYTAHRNDLPGFWNAVTATFGQPATMRLQLDGKLAYLTLNNAPLIGKVRASAGANGLADAAELVDLGYHRADTWQAAVAGGRVPPEIQGASDKEREQRYAEVLAAQVRISYPTRVVAQMVKTGETPVDKRASDGIHTFLVEHEGRFDLAAQPVEQYLRRNQLQLDPIVQQQLTRVQRVYQITPGDSAMNALLAEGVDSAYAVTRYDRSEFVRRFAPRVGGEAQARLVHVKAQQVHNTVLNVALSYLTAANAPGVGVHSPAQIVNPAPGPNPNATDVIAYSTLETLFGSMDYCACDECRSILSPAAYLVDLLLCCDRPENELENPLTVLLERRPDLQHLPLTCENTNTPLPYIDVVNETLEYYISNGLSLGGYTGHTIDDTARPAELLANPQFVTEAAYVTLAGRPINAGDPPPLLPPTPPLPFHQPLEKLRRYVGRFDASLSAVMEDLRPTDALERPAPADPAHPVEYGWRDILMEHLRLSRPEHALLTDRARPLQQLYGFPPATTDAQVLDALGNAKAFCRRLAIEYVDLVDILRTRFVNPGAWILPRFERLGVSIATIKAFKDGALAPAEFDAALAPQLDPAAYGGDIKAWVLNPSNFDTIMGLITLTDPTGTAPAGTFDAIELRYASPDMTANRLRVFEFVRLYRFVRLWRKLGWSIDLTDRAIAALYPAAQTPNDPSDAINRQRLDAGFLTLLPRLAVVTRMMAALSVKPSKELPSALACFAPIDATGDASLYRQMFLSPARLDQDAAFADDGFGNVLPGGETLLAHAPALRAAFSLADEELALIADALHFDTTTPLTLATISAVFRRGWLARKLKISVLEFLRLATYTGIDPFAAPDPVDPPALELVRLIGRLKARAVKPAQLLYLIWNEDVSGRSAPPDDEITGFARTLRASLAAITREFTVTSDPDGQIAPARMALVYGREATDLFFGLLNQAVVTDVDYTHAAPSLAQDIVDAAAGKLAYDDLRKRLAYTAGVMPDGIRGALVGLAGATAAFVDAVNALAAKTRAFFVRFPELEPLHDAFVASAAPPEEKRATLLAALLPQLEEQRKRQQTLQALAAAAEMDDDMASALADDAAVLHGTAGPARPALEDVRVVETGGLSARWWFASAVNLAAPPDTASDAVSALAYGAGGRALPANPTPGNAVSGIWSGYVEAPENGFYNLRIDTDAAATASLSLDGASVPLARNGNRWSNAGPIELTAGTLHAIEIRVDRVTTEMTVRWQTLGSGWDVIPAELLYPATLTDRLRRVYVRVQKAASLSALLKLSSAEIAYLAAHPGYAVAGDGWLNALPVTGTPTPPVAAGLYAAVSAALEYARLKDALQASDDRLLQALRDPIAATAASDSLLFTLTRWDPESLDALLVRLGYVQAAVADRHALANLAAFARVFDAYAWVKALRVPAAALVAAATNEPDAPLVRGFQGALRARYEEADWLDTLKPINDELRSLQRDALVGYVLHQMRSTPATAHIDTADKLFEYFLMDVEMQPCMQTSRIRHALSSAQLFIERCLMNLEPRVAASSINATQWEWMRRYRVWQANRKIFLYPENWLEPELRDDQSAFFKETMSELLQSDITEDAAAAALVGYLSKLEEVAKLEPCGIHYAEYDPAKAEDDIAHVVARTAGARRKYFYRRREFGYWTPWEAIKLDIEDDPVVPVLWKNRLLLFWTKIIRQAPLQTPAVPTGDLADVDAATTVNANSRISVHALLCWSEYYNGKWTPSKTSDPNAPVLLGTFTGSGAGAFDRSKLRFSIPEADDTLVVFLGGQGSAAFTLYNTHSLPEPGGPLVFFLGPSRVLDTAGNTLAATYYRGLVFAVPGVPPADPTLPRPILTTPLQDRVVETAHPLADTWDAPFFYEDRRHVFYVETRQRDVRVRHWDGYDFDGPQVEVPENIPPLVFQQDPVPDPIGPVIAPEQFGIVDPVSMTRYVTEDAYITRGFATSKPVQFGTSLIGPGGKAVAPGQR